MAAYIFGCRIVVQDSYVLSISRSVVSFSHLDVYSKTVLS